MYLEVHMKQCKCGETDLSKFGKDKNKADGLKTACKACRNKANNERRNANPENHRKTNLAYARSNHGRNQQRMNNLRRKYWPHMTNEQAQAEYDRLLVEQNHSCALCGRHQSTMKTAFHVDHCKDPHIVRGLLCDFCNRVEVQDKSLDRVLKLVAYFQKYHGGGLK